MILFSFPCDFLVSPHFCLACRDAIAEPHISPGLGKPLVRAPKWVYVWFWAWVSLNALLHSRCRPGPSQKIQEHMWKIPDKRKKHFQSPLKTGPGNFSKCPPPSSYLCCRFTCSPYFLCVFNLFPICCPLFSHALKLFRSFLFFSH